MLVADGTVTLVGAPAEVSPPTSVVTPTSTPGDGLTGVDDPAVAGAAGGVTCTSCWPGVAEPLVGGPLVGLNNLPGALGVVVVRRPREARSESTAVSVPSTRLVVWVVSDWELPPGTTDDAGAACWSVLGGTAFASPGPANTPQAKAVAAATAPKKLSRDRFAYITSCFGSHPGSEKNCH